MPTLELSPNTRRWVEGPRPRWRGRSHHLAAVASVPVGVWLTLQAPAGRARLGVAVFTAGIAVMFAVSAVVHRRRWPARTTELLLRADHTAIYLAIAAAATPLALLGLDGWQRALLLGWCWLFAAVGIVVEWLPFAPRRGFSNGMYFTMSAPAAALLPWLVANTGYTTVALLLAGGVLYVAGAIIVAVRRPDPDPEVFGYHEIWHLMVIAAVAAHYGMLWTLL